MVNFRTFLPLMVFFTFPLSSETNVLGAKNKIFTKIILSFHWNIGCTSIRVIHWTVPEFWPCDWDHYIFSANFENSRWSFWAVEVLPLAQLGSTSFRRCSKLLPFIVTWQITRFSWCQHGSWLEVSTVVLHQNLYLCHNLVGYSQLQWRTEHRKCVEQ